MKQKTIAEAPRLRERVPYAGLAVVFLVVGMTLGSAGANMIPMKLPSHDEMQRAEQADTTATRRQHLAAMVLEGDHCKPVVASEIARLLVFDGQSARAYTEDFAKRCGEIESVARWGLIAPPDKANVHPPRRFAAL
ncbi:MAG TPA: hypothetical protein VGM39_25655 [Kofleriaceae bacterium]|jgi:hypothetical protein